MQGFIYNSTKKIKHKKPEIIIKIIEEKYDSAIYHLTYPAESMVKEKYL
jgi:hypothetical protein